MTRSHVVDDAVSPVPLTDLPKSWAEWCHRQCEQDYFRRLVAFLVQERSQHEVYPPAAETFAALQRTSFQQVRVLLLGQDPYHDQGQAHGLCFSVPAGVRLPPSLRNIFRELHDDLGCPLPQQGSLHPWAAQGVLLLNTVLTVRAHQPHSHRGRGWERFTDAVIRRLNRRRQPVVFVLWGAPAQQKLPLIDTRRHHVVTSPHPSPLSAHRGFFGSKPFSKINALLTSGGLPPIDWSL